MLRHRWSALLLIVLVATTVQAQRRRSASAGNGWSRPTCSKITGLEAIRYVAADGTLVKSEKQAVNTWASDLVASPLANTLYAVHEGALYVSRNAGCMWRLQANLPGFHDVGVQLLATHGRLVYAYSQETLARIDGGDVEMIAFPERMLRLGSNRVNALHLRGVAIYGNVYESTDGGDTWALLGDASQSMVYSAAFDPSDFDHILAGTTDHGRMMASRDGGRTWTRTALPPTNSWSVEFSARDPRVVWVQGWEINAAERLYRSRDGGETYERVLTFAEQGLLFSRSILAPHPTDPETVAMSAHQGAVIFRGGQTTLIGPVRPKWMTWSPAGTFYFVAPDSEFIIN